MVTPANQGGDTPIDPMGGGSRSGAQGTARLQTDLSLIDRLISVFGRFEDRLRSLGRTAQQTFSTINNGMAGIGTPGVGLGGATGSRINVPNAADVNQRFQQGRGRGLASNLRSLATTAGGGPPGFATLAAIQAGSDIAQATSQRIGRGAEYALQADRMTVQLQQMYGMSNRDVRQQLRLPLTQHYLLGGGTAINDLLGMQATTGLTAARQASTVEAFRTVSGFSLGSSDVTRMLTTMASPDVANRMFMMGGTGMYGIGGRERTGMQTVQDIVRRTGLTTPEALKGALQQGSNTRQRLTAMGVPPDMQDMVIQYAMQNMQFQRKTGDKGMMYDPSMEEDRRVLGVEDTYALQHEKTTGERLKREERFYDKQTGAFSQFERNLRTSTKVLAAFEDALSSIIGMAIGAKGHPITETVRYGANLAYQAAATRAAMSGIQVAGDISGAGDPTPQDEKILSGLQSRLAEPIRQMMAENPNIHLSPGGGRRSAAVQESEFKRRYRPRPDLKEKTKDADRVWNGVVWEYVATDGSAAMAPPGQSLHEQGLAVDFLQTSKKDMDWLVANAARFGLSTGATGRGGPADEPFHVQPSSIPMGSKPGGKSATVPTNTVKSSKGVSAASVKPMAPTMQSPAVFTNAGAMAAQAEKAGLKAQFSPIISGIDKPVSNVGDPADSARMASGGGINITVSPTINLNGGSEMSGDLRRIAREVGKILEQEVSMVMARSR